MVLHQTKNDNIESQLSDSFEDPERFLRMLTCCRAIVSGSRAAQCFSKHACVKSSDWDIFITDTIHGIVGMAQYLQNYENVEWKQPSGLRTFRMALFSNGCIPLQELSSIEEIARKRYDEYLRNQYLRDHVSADSADEVSKSNNITEYHLNTICVVHSLLPVRENSEERKKIQLIWRSEESAIGCVLKFHFSAVQCFITVCGHCTLS